VQGHVGKREDEDRTTADTLEDDAPPAVAAVQLMIAPHVGVGCFQPARESLDNVFVESRIADE